MTLFDIFRRKKIFTLSAFSADMAEDEFHSMLSFFSEHLFDVVQRSSIQFYRDIHSHEADPFPKVKDEFFYLMIFVLENKIRSLSRSDTDVLVYALRDIISRRMIDIDRTFDKEKFWGIYSSREAAYSAPYGKSLQQDEPAMAEALPSIFSGFLLEHLDSPKAIIRHHAIQMALEAVYLLEGHR